jgi:inositol transport system ATP-binding protein
MKILAGISGKDSGEILLLGVPVDPKHPKDSMDLGIAMIHQELNPVPEMSIAENIFLGREPTKGPLRLLDRRRMSGDAAALFSRLGLDFDPRLMMSALSVSQKQMVEIAKAISYDSRIIVMDEPTSAITSREVDRLFGIIALLKSHGVGIIYISHKMEEIFCIADRITVLRDGKLIGTKTAAETGNAELISMMVGRELSDVFPSRAPRFGAGVLRVEGLASGSSFSGIGFELRAGEILGIAGLMGAGRTEVVQTIFGLRKRDAGTIYVDGKPAKIRTPADAIRLGIAFVSEDRKASGLNLKGSVKDNIALLCLRAVSFLGVIRKRAETAVARRQIEALMIKTPSERQLAGNLSGGNQQKVVVAKWLLASPRILIMDEPTRGIDVAAKAEIYRLISGLAGEGKAVILISSELPEIIGLCDRVLVMHEGKGMGLLERGDATQEAIMTLATGQARAAC